MAFSKSDPVGYGWFHRNSFYSTTHLSGFGFIYVTHHRLEILFWYLAITACSCVLVSDIYELLDQFFNDKTSIEMRMNFNSSIVVPAFTVCVKARLPDYNWGFPEYRPLSWRGSDDYPFWAELNANMSATKSKSDFLASSWPYIYLPLLQRHLTFMLYSEQPEYFPRSVKWRDYQMKPPDTDDAYFTPFKRYPAKPNVTNTLLAFAHSLGVTDDELLDKYSDEVKRLFGLDAFISDTTMNNEQQSLSGRLTWMDGERTCFGFDNADADVSLGDYSVLSVATNMRRVADLEAMQPFYRFDTKRNTEHVQDSSLSVSLGLSQPPPIIPDVHIAYKSTLQATVSVQAAYESMKNCSQSLDELSTCKQLCRAQLIRDMCDCQMISNRHFYDIQQSLCSSDGYLKCLKYNVTDDAECRAGCHPPCHQLHQRIDVKATGVKDFINERIENHNMLLRIAYRPQPFPLFVEQSAVTWQNFIGDLGGIFDFWLGVNILGLIHVLVYALKRLLHGVGLCHSMEEKQQKLHFPVEQTMPEVMEPNDEKQDDGKDVELTLTGRRKLIRKPTAPTADEMEDGAPG